MLFEHYLLILLSILPIIYKYSFWLFTIQLKEYRWDRFTEYLGTKQGKSAIINMWSVIEFPLFIMSFIVFFNAPFEILIFNILLIFLLLQNLFVFRKLIKKQILKPKLTGRLLLTLSLVFVGISGDMLYLILTGQSLVLYPYILFLLLMPYLVIFLTIIVSLPLVNYLKNKKIKLAIEKSNKINEVIKVGITGSFGKSSIKEYLSCILEQDGKTLKTPENINTELGVSAIVLSRLKKSYKYFVAEMGAYKIGEIDLLGKIVNHKYGFLTAVGNQHIGLFGSQDNIKKGKSEIANSVLKNNGILYVNWDNVNIKTIKFNKKLNIVKYGTSIKSDAKSKIITNSNGKIEFEFTYNKIKTTFTTSLLGKHNIINLTGVIAFCYDIGLKTTEIKKYLKNITPPKNTLNISKSKSLTLIDDTYNLSEEGLLSGIEVLKTFNGNKVLVLDDILELGKNSEKIHKKIGEKIAKEKKVDQIILCGINYKESIISGLINGGFKNKDIIESLKDINKNSIILFEGRNSKKYLNKLK